ncbi:MAG: translation elongation factor 4 [Minisyncoccia bacterium]
MERKFIRNFCIISHIDHGKSTLADRFLELTNTVSKEKLRPQYLDSMNLEREKGITIKMHPVRMIYESKKDNQKYILNLIDTPGHTDFSYEVSRSLAAVEGAILLVDATQGIQAQTIFNFEMAKKQNLKIIGVVNKIDLKEANVSQTKKDLAKLLDQKEDEIFQISAKTGQNVDILLEAIIEKLPPPQKIENKETEKLKALLFDSKYDPFFGIIIFVRIFSGRVKTGDIIYFLNKKISSQVKEVGYFTPDLKANLEIKEGEIGYIKTGIKDPQAIRIGDTISNDENLKPLEGYRQIEPVLYLSFYPKNPDAFLALKNAFLKLKLQDPSLFFESEKKYSLGQGFKVGFLGLLHTEITIRRLKEEFNLEILATQPQVVFLAKLKNKKEIKIFSPQEFPHEGEVEEFLEPYYELEILIPDKYYDEVFKLLRNFKATIKDIIFFSSEKIILKAIAPLKEIICDFYENLKNITQGYGSFSLKFSHYQKTDLVKLEIKIAGKTEEIFSKIADREKAALEGRKIILKLKDVFPAQQFAVPLQAVVSNKVLAREDIPAKRKDVTAPLYGGDFTRKRKLLEKQKEGKKKLKEKSQISSVPSEVFLKMLSSN